MARGKLTKPKKIVDHHPTHAFPPSEETQKIEKTSAQRSTSIPKSTFTRIVKAMAKSSTGKDFKWSKQVKDLLQEASEAMVVELFDKMGFCAFVNGRIIVQPRDFAVSLFRPQPDF